MAETEHRAWKSAFNKLGALVDMDLDQTRASNRRAESFPALLFGGIKRPYLTQIQIRFLEGPA